MFVDATEGGMQVIEHRVSRIQHRSFDGNYFASNCNADLIGFMQRWGEPTASLDLAHQVRIMDLMEKLKADKGVTVVMVSHDINLAAMYGGRLLLLRDGQIVCMGPPKEILNFKTLEDTYGCKLLVDESPLGKLPRLTVVPQRFLKA